MPDRKSTRKNERKNTRKNERKNTRKNEHRMSGGAATVGSKAMVFHGTAKHTSGGLTKADLVMNKRGHIVSRKQMMAGKKAFKHLAALGYKPKKGVFKLFTKKTKKSKKQSK